MQINDIDEGTRCSFEVYPDTYITNQFKDVILEGIVTSRTATQLGFDIWANHQNVYPSLVAAGVSVPNDPTQYTYAYISFAGGETTFVGVPWIRAGSVTSSEGQNLTLTFNNRNDVRRKRILEALSAIGETPDSQIWS